MKAPKQKNLELYTIMLEIRLFEEKIAQMYREAQIPGFIHLCIGEEAVAAGVCAALNKDDYVVSTHRGHGHCLAKGANPGKLMAEICGKAAGYCKGRGGSMHLFCPEVGLLGTCGIVGAGIPMAVGAALQAKLRKTGQVSVAFFGDGACNNGTFHESLNLAALWKLPVLFVCENNLYATSVSAVRSTSVENIAVRGASYGISGIVADGMNVLDVYEKALTAIVRARSGEGPSLIECKTYRFHGHYEGDPGTDYRTNQEVKRWIQKDPVKKMKKYLLNKDMVDEKKLSQIEDSIKTEIEEAAIFALASSYPQPDDALAEV